MNDRVKELYYYNKSLMNTNYTISGLGTLSLSLERVMNKNYLDTFISVSSSIPITASQQAFFNVITFLLYPTSDLFNIFTFNTNQLLINYERGAIRIFTSSATQDITQRCYITNYGREDSVYAPLNSRTQVYIQTDITFSAYTFSVGLTGKSFGIKNINLFTCSFESNSDRTNFIKSIAYNDILNNDWKWSI